MWPLVLISDLPDQQQLFVDADDPKSIASESQWFLIIPCNPVKMGERGRQKIISAWNYEKQFQPVLNAVSR
jgi:hypothetical protein